MAGSQDLLINNVLARNVRVFGPDDSQMRVEGTDGAGAAVMQTQVFSRIARGQMFSQNLFNGSLGAGSTMEFLLRVKNEPIHLFNFLGRSSDSFRLDLFEGVTVSDAGSASIIKARDRNSTLTTSMEVRTGASFTGSTSIFTLIAPVGSDGMPLEFILKLNTDYITRFTNLGSGTSESTMSLDWYENVT